MEHWRFRMHRRSILWLFCGIVAVRAAAQTPPSNPPAPTPIPTVVPAIPVTAAPAQTAVPTIVLDTFDSVTQRTTPPAEDGEASIHADPSAVHARSIRRDRDCH